MTFLLPLLARFWFVVPIALLMASTAYYRGQTHQEHAKRIEVEAAYEQFKAGVKIAGEAAQAAAKAKDQANEKTIKSAVAGRADALRRLRDAESNTSSRSVPLVPAAAAGDRQICFDPPALTAAVERYRARVRGLAQSGDEAQIDAQALIDGWPK